MNFNSSESLLHLRGLAEARRKYPPETRSSPQFLGLTQNMPNNFSIMLEIVRYHY